MHVDDETSLLDNVRSAVAAEFTTIPAYLYAYWSIRPASDGGSDAAQTARASIRTVISEEMLHMALASNLLNALGGSPCLTQAPYLPTYPCYLLRSVASPTGTGAPVDLVPLSDRGMQLMLGIERPEWDAQGKSTLGSFYETEICANLPPDNTAYGSGRQVQPWNNPGPGVVYAIASWEDASTAIGEIVHQGEGLSRQDHDDGDNELAHYWRFKAVSDQIDTGSIDLDRDVYPVVASPTKAVVAYTPEQLAANERFNRAYSRMLDALEAMLSGDQPDVYPLAAGYMRQLHLLADQLRATGPIPGSALLPGPTFEYIPTESA